MNIFAANPWFQGVQVGLKHMKFDHVLQSAVFCRIYGIDPGIHGMARNMYN